MNAENKNFNKKLIVMNLKYLKKKQKNSLLELLQKYENMFDGTLGKYAAFNYTIELNEDAKPYQTLFLFLKFTN